MKKQQEKISEVEKAKKTLQQEKEARGKRVGEGLQKLLKENNCNIGVKVTVTSPKELPQIDFIITPND